MKNQSFKLTINLATPFIMGRTRTTLDSLLSAAIFRKTGLKGSDCIPHIPLEQEHGIFKASSLFISDESRLSHVKAGRTMSLKGLNDLSVDHFLPNSANGQRYLAVDQARGPYKSNMSEYSALSATEVCFYGVGDAEAVKELIETYIPGIGAHSSQGAGQILDVQYELLSNESDFSWITESGKPARPLPVEIWNTLPSIDSVSVKGAANVTVRFPYWDHDNSALAVFPIEYTYF